MGFKKFEVALLMLTKGIFLKVIKAIMAMLRTLLPGCDDGPFRQVFKVLLPCEKEEKKRVFSCIIYFLFLSVYSCSLPCAILYSLCTVVSCRLLTILTKYLLQGNVVLFQLLVTSLVQKYQALLRGLCPSILFLYCHLITLMNPFVAIVEIKFPPSH